MAIPFIYFKSECVCSKRLLKNQAAKLSFLLPCRSCQTCTCVLCAIFNSTTATGGNHLTAFDSRQPSQYDTYLLLLELMQK